MTILFQTQRKDVMADAKLSGICSKTGYARFRDSIGAQTRLDGRVAAALYMEGREVREFLEVAVRQNGTFELRFGSPKTLE
jgi:hypothetical protein